MGYDTEVLVIGGGPAGYTAAIRASQLGVDVTLAEKDAYGGTCLNTGCIPSKALISAANMAHEAGTAAQMGIDANPIVDYSTLSNWKSNIVSQFTRSVEKLCKANNISLIDGEVQFESDHTATVTRTEGDESNGTSISFQYAIIATGSKPISIPGFNYEDEPIWNSSHALTASSSPDELVVVGAGYIGMELATMFSKIGTDVTVIEALDDALPAYGSDVTHVVKKRLKELGVDLQFGERAASWNESTDTGQVELVTESVDEKKTYLSDRILVAIGREPISETVAPEKIGITRDDRGFIETDGSLRTSRDHIFAIGDVAGEPMLAHKANHEAIRAARSIAPDESSVSACAVPSVIFTDPEIATVGYTQEEAEADGYDTRIGEIPLRSNGRALSMAETDGFVRIITSQNGSIIGGTIVGPEASELISEIALAVQLEAKAEQVAATIHPHPTLAEAIKEAAENVRDKAIHSLNR